jgi:branched-chain amino acid aminotransferase
VNPRSPFVWWRGGLVRSEEASLPFLTPALHYGIGAFEGIRAYRTDRGTAIFRLDEHVERLLASTRVLGLTSLPWSAAQIRDAIVATVRANGFPDCYVRPLVFLASGGWDLDLGSGTPELGIAVWEWRAYLGEAARERGVRAHVSSFTRHHPNVTMTKAKLAGNYVNSVLAKTESRRLGFDEAIQLDTQGFVAECTGENLFVVRGGRLLCPPAATTLEGITRDTLITIACGLGYTVQEAPISRDQLYIADEVFVCGTAAEVVAVREVDGRPVGDGACGAVTRQLQEAYEAAVRGRQQRYESWLTRLDLAEPGVASAREQADREGEASVCSSAREFSALLRNLRPERAMTQR